MQIIIIIKITVLLIMANYEAQHYLKIRIQKICSIPVEKLLKQLCS